MIDKNKINRSLIISESLYTKFKLKCIKKGINISDQIEYLIQKDLNDIE